MHVNYNTSEHSIDAYHLCRELAIKNKHKFYYKSVKISSDKKEFGHAELNIVADSVLFNNLDKKINVWMSHGDQVQDLPDDYELLALTNTAPIAAMQHKNLPIYAIQFHPEVTHTKNGITILENFMIMCLLIVLPR